jgi:hypothetical protein
MKDINWNLLCGIIDIFPKESSEKQYQEVIETFLIEHCLGWEKNKDFFSQYQVQMGSTKKEDIVIKRNDNVVIAIEVKLSTASTGNKQQEQLGSYMRSITPLPVNFGILIGKSIKFFYENLREDIAMQLIFEVDFEEDNEVGVLFLELFNKSTFDVEELHEFCKQQIEKLKSEEEAKAKAKELLADKYKMLLDEISDYLSQKYNEKVAEIIKNSISISPQNVKKTDVGDESKPFKPKPINNTENELWEKIKSLKAEKHGSWVQLREGCMFFLSGNKCRQNAKSFASTIIKQTGLTPQEIIDLLDARGK